MFCQSLSYQCTPRKPNQINLDLSVKSVLLTGYPIWFVVSELMCCRLNTVTG